MKQMRAVRLGTTLVLAALAVLLAVGVHAQAPNLLANPGFEAPFAIVPGDPQMEVASGWQPWWVPREPDMTFSQNLQPEYYPASNTSSALGIPQIRSGEDAQQLFTFFGTFTGGIYQSVANVVSGETYRFSAFVHVWSSSLDNPALSEQPGNLSVQVGIDPTGGTDGTSPAIIWSPVGAFIYDSFNEYAVTAQAAASTITVWVRGTAGIPVKQNVLYIDDAALTGPSTATAAPPTDVASAPSATASATATAVSTTAPAASLTASATAVPVTPSATLTPSITSTPAPTATIDNTQFPGRFVYQVQPGDTVFNIAAAYGTTPEAIISANGLQPNGLIFVGQQLIIPVRLPFVPPTATPFASPTAINVPSVPTTAPPQPQTITYVVRPGDTLFWIAVRFNTTVNAIASLNNISNPNLIFVGQRLLIPAAGAQAVPTSVTIPTAQGQVAQPPQTYIVRPGDNLYNISIRFGVPVSAIVQANGIPNPNRIYVGQTLIIP